MATIIGILLIMRMIDGSMNSRLDPRCEQMRIPWCTGAYDSVILPNFFGHKTQEDAYTAMRKLWPLIHSRCSGEIGEYFCPLYVPQCPYLVGDRDESYVSYSEIRTKPPCEESCLRVKEDCQRVLIEQNMKWPDELSCHHFRGQACLEKPTVEVRPTDMSGRNQWSQTIVSTQWWKPPTTRPAPTTKATVRPTTSTPRITTVEVTTRKTTLGSTSTKSSVPSTWTAKIALTSTQKITTVGIIDFNTTALGKQENMTKSATPESVVDPKWITSTSLLGITPVIEEEKRSDDDIDMDLFDLYNLDDLVDFVDPSSDEINFEPPHEASFSQCLPLSIPFCTKFGYNRTNIDEERQNMASIHVRYFTPLMQVKCSDDLEAFLCSAYAPPCNGMEMKENVLPPCRSFCQSVKSDCDELMEKLGFRWPDGLECQNYPVDTQKCVQGLVEMDEDEDTLDPPILIRPPVEHPDTVTQTVTQESIDQPITYRSSDQCESIFINTCMNGFLYNSTRLPNMFGHRDQLEAELSLAQYQPIIDYECSPDMRTFMCAVYLPPCDLGDRDNRSAISPVLPCKNLCESAKNGCKPALNMHGLAWPERFDCDRFPDHRSSICVGHISDQNDQITPQPTLIQAKDDKSKSKAWEALKQTAPLNPECQKMSQTSMCNGLYEKVIFPNELNHVGQMESELELKQYTPVVKSECSQDMLPFLCSVYIPVCTVLKSPIPPCRELCLSAKFKCEPVMNSMGFRWPLHFNNCTQYPSEESGQLCVDKMEKHTDRSSVIDSDQADRFNRSDSPEIYPITDVFMHNLGQENQSVNNQILNWDNKNMSFIPTADASLSSACNNGRLSILCSIICFACILSCLKM